MGPAEWIGSGATPMSALVLPLGSSLSFGLYGVVSFVALPLLRCVCSFAASYTACSWGPCWLTIALRYLHARMAALRVPGPSSGWFLAAVASMSRASSSGDLVGSVPRGGMRCCSTAVCWCLLGARQVDWDVQCWLRTPPIKEVNAWQWCDFLGRAGLW